MSTSLLGRVPRRAALGSLMAASVLIGSIFAASLVSAGEIAGMTAPEAHEKANKGEIVFVDIRTPEEWSQTGVPASAYTITMHQAPEKFFSGILKAAGGDLSKPVAVICRTGNRSAMISEPLRQAGFKNVIDVGEGVVGGKRGRGWIARGLPLRQWSPDDKGPEIAAQ
jgi:rhodanese-related sulfurtransferase